MNMLHPHRATIPPVPEGTPRPLWSVMIPTYNCAGYLRETLASVLAQDPGPEVMQIEVVDDCSTRDDPEAVVRELGGGRVGFYRQPQNVGHVGNFNTCLRRSRGHLVHQLHGDDRVRPGFYRTLGNAFRANPGIGSAFCRNVVIDEQGHWERVSGMERDAPGLLNGWLERIAAGQRLQTPSVVVRREVYERLGGFDRRLAWTEDWEMWVRIAAYYPVWFEPEPLAEYRMHRASSTGRLVQTAETIRDTRRAININRGHLSPELQVRVTRRAMLNCAYSAVRRGHRMFEAGHPGAGLAHLREGLRTSLAPGVIAQAAGVLTLWGGRKARAALSPPS